MSTKAIQGQLWSVAPDFWTYHFEPWFSPMYRHVLSTLNLNEDHSVLDAGCGSGLFTTMAAKTGAKLIGIDAAPGLLEVARRRNPGINFLEEDLEAMPFADNSFDVVAGFNSFQYAGSFESALVEAKRVLKSGGRLVLAIWAKPALSDATNILKAIGTLLPPLPPDHPGPFALSEDGKIEGTLEKNGIKLHSRTVVACPFNYASLEDGVKSFMGTGPAAAAINHTKDKKLVEDTIAKALKEFNTADGLHFLQNHFLVFVGEK